MTDLFTALDALPARTLCRRDGPATSRAAAERIVRKLGDKQARALEAIRRWPDRTQLELDALEPDPHDQRAIGKRCGELVKLGLVVVSGVRDGRQTYRIKGV